MRSLLSLTITLLVLVGCAERSVIDPTFSTVTTSEQMSAATYKTGSTEIPVQEGETKARVKYLIKDISFNDFTGSEDKKNPIEQLGKAILETFARGIMLVGGNFELDLDSITYPLPDFDREMIKGVYVKSILFEVSDSVKNKKGMDLGFLEELKLVASSAVENKERLLIDFDSDKDTCAGDQCVEIRAEQVNLLDLVDEGGAITFTPSIKIGDAPSKKLVVNGLIDLVVVMRLPF